MKLQNHIHSAIVTAAILMLFSTSLIAAFVFDPDGPPVTPAVIVAPYAVSTNSLLGGGTNAYRPWFENGAWQGDIIEYDIDEFGNKTTDANVGSNPAVDGIASGGNNWMARARFDANESDPDYWLTGRNIFTSDGADNQIEFFWDNLDATQKQALDLASFNADSAESEILNFVRGDRSSDISSAGTLRYRFNLLGDIINSWPVYISRPKEGYTIPGFLDFKQKHFSRQGRMAVGAIDGLLHVFNAETGNEVYAYAPTALFSKLNRLTATPYRHSYFVDGQLTVGSAQVTDSVNPDNPYGWSTILTGGLGAGGKGIFAIDMTDPDYSANKLVFEKTGGEFGYIYGRPRLGRLADEKWYVFTGNGYDNTDTLRTAKLLVTSLDAPHTVQAISTGSEGSLSAPTLVDSNKDLKVDLAFAGDTYGNMWRFDFNQAFAVGTNPRKIYAAPDDSQPITAAPVVGFHPRGGHMVYFGTGSVSSYAEAIDDDYPTQAIYGIWDNAIGTEIVTQTMSTNTTAFDPKVVRYDNDNEQVVNYAPCLVGETVCEHLGWKVPLGDAGERVIAQPNLRAGRVSVITTNPLGYPTNDAGEYDPDGTRRGTGSNWIMSLNYLTGSHNTDIVLNLNGDGVLDNNDAIPCDDTDTADFVEVCPPTGLYLGASNLSQPTIAELTAALDLFLVNGLRLTHPLIEPVDGPFIFGHIDVETDSPAGGSKAPNDIADMSEGYQIRAGDYPDGLGRAVDGHVHGYDTIHNITYVDLFELEPRRGLADLGATSIDPVSEDPETGCPPGSSPVTNEDGTVLTGCIDTIDAELNRAYDNLDLAAPRTDATRKSEVFGFSNTRGTPQENYKHAELLADDQAFIVVLANADRSPAGVLQIGCRTWDVTDYQDMITSQLVADPDPSKLMDTYHGDATLVFTFAEIANSGVCPQGSPSARPTIRVDFDRLGIQNQGLHPTRSQCVLGLHDYRDDLDYWDEEVLCYAPKQLDGEGVSCPPVTFTKGDPVTLREPPPGYIRDPADNLHITQMASQEGTGYRWRNGALTIQLLAVNADGSAAYTLQEADNGAATDADYVQYLPADNKGNLIGGIIARAFWVDAAGNITADDSVKGPNESGLLHETTAYWHYGDLSDGVQRGAPSDVPCYGGNGYGGAFAQELRGLNFGQYADLFDDIAPDVLTQYDQAIQNLLEAIDSGLEGDINQALLTLAKLLDVNPDLWAYHRFRDYGPGVIPEDKLRDIDQGQTGDSGGDDVIVDSEGPANPIDVEQAASGLGNNFKPGRRTWIDIRQ